MTRIQSIEGLNKILGERSKGGEGVKWAFWNLGRVLGWVECGGRAKVSPAHLDGIRCRRQLAETRLIPLSGP